MRSNEKLPLWATNSPTGILSFCFLFFCFAFVELDLICCSLGRLCGARFIHHMMLFSLPDRATGRAAGGDEGRPEWNCSNDVISISISEDTWERPGRGGGANWAPARWGLRPAAKTDRQPSFRVSAGPGFALEGPAHHAPLGSCESIL